MDTIYMYVIFKAVWIIATAKKDETRPDKEIGSAVHYNGGSSRWGTDRSHSCR